jgi:hypothetical protein
MDSQKIPTEREERASEGLQVANEGGSLETVPQYSDSPTEKPFLQPDSDLLEQSQREGSRNRRRIFRIPIFWLLIGTVTFLIGGGIGAGFTVLGLKKGDKSSRCVLWDIPWEHN